MKWTREKRKNSDARAHRKIKEIKKNEGHMNAGEQKG